jgi:hypothetical protein
LEERERQAQQVIEEPARQLEVERGAQVEREEGPHDLRDEERGHEDGHAPCHPDQQRGVLRGRDPIDQHARDRGDDQPQQLDDAAQGQHARQQPGLGQVGPEQ